MASSEFIEVLSPSAFSDVQKLAQEIDKVVVKVNEANRAFKVIQLPSSGKQLAKENEQISHSIVDLTKQTNQLTQARTKASQKTSEEIVNSRILRQNADLEARATSSLAGEYQKLTARRAQSAKSLQDLVVRGKLAGQSQREYNRELRNAQKEYDKLDGKVVKANRAINRFNDNVGNYPKKAVSGLRDLIGAFGVIGGVTAVAAITKDIFNTTREIQSLDLALKQVIGTQEDFVQTQQFLSRISEAYGAEINTLTKSFTSFFVAAKDQMDRSDIEGIFESITKAAGAMGLSVEQQEGTFLALTQMISKGTIQAEELRGQLSERLPGAFGILAKSMGVTEKELNKMLEQGQVMAVDVLPKFAKELEKAYGVENLQRVESLNASTTRLSNSWTGFIRELNEGSGVVTKFFSWFVDGAALALDALGDLIQSKESLLKEVQEEGRGRGFSDAMNLIKESADSGAGSMEDWAQSIKNLAEPKVKSMNEELKKQQWILKNSDNAWYKYFNPSSWKQHNDSKQRIKELNEEIAYNEGRLEAANKVLAGTAPTKEKDIELTDKQKKALQKLREEHEKDIYTLNRLRLENEIAANERVFEDDKVNYTKREKAFAAYISLKEQMSDNALKEDLRVIKLTSDEEIAELRKRAKEGEITERNANAVIYSIQKQAQFDSLKAQEDYYERERQINLAREESFKGVWEAINFQKAQNLIDTRSLDDLSEYNSLVDELARKSGDYRDMEAAARDFQLANRDISKANIQLEIDRIETELRGLKDTEANVQKRLELEDQLINKKADLAKVSKEQIDEEVAAVTRLQQATENYLNTFTTNAFSDFGLSSLSGLFDQVTYEIVNDLGEIETKTASTFQKMMDGANTSSERFAVAFNTITTVAQEAFNFLNQNSQAYFDSIAARIEREKDFALTYAETSEAKEEIDKQYEERKRQLRYQEAKQQKETAIFNAIINTAQAVTSALPNIPLSVAVGILGAAQIALIAARPIPQYEFGTANHPGGYMMVNDAKGSNFREMIFEPGKAPYIPEKRNAIINAPKGTKVLTAKDTMRELNGMLYDNTIGWSNGQMPYPTHLLPQMPRVEINNGGGITKADLKSALNETLGKMNQMHISIDNKGIKTLIGTENAKAQVLNNSVNRNKML